MTNNVKIAKHPDTKHSITFRESDHSYIDNLGSRYVSCTTFFKPFSHEFDAVKVSEKCSLGDNPKYIGRSPEEIREEWFKEGDRGRTEGTNVHEYAEWYMVSKSILSSVVLKPKPISKRSELLFSQARTACKKLLKRFKFIAAEVIVFSPDLKIAGTIDLLMYDPKTNEIIIIDWKATKRISIENIYQNAFSPIEHLQDTDINKYSLQLSLYQYIMIKENYFPKAKGYRRALIHLSPEKATPINLEYHDYEIKEIINQ